MTTVHYNNRTHAVHYNNHTHAVDVDGRVYQAIRLNSIELDNIRVEAGKDYLASGMLTREQYQYWKRVCSISDPKNRGESKGVPNHV